MFVREGVLFDIVCHDLEIREILCIVANYFLSLVATNLQTCDLYA